MCVHSLYLWTSESRFVKFPTFHEFQVSNSGHQIFVESYITWLQVERIEEEQRWIAYGR